MNLTRCCLTTAVALLALTASAEPEAEAENGKDWSHHTGKLDFTIGLAKGLEKAKADKKPAMLFITTTWCGWCTRLAKDTFSNDEVVKALSAFTPVLVDGDVEKAACQKYGVQGFPNLRFVTPDGEAFGQMGGYLPPDKFMTALKPILEKIGASLEAKPEPEKDWSAHLGKLPFTVGYAKGMEKAKADKKPVLLFITTTWCGWCKKLAEDTFSNEEVVKALSGFTPVLVDGDVDKDACEKFGAEGYPALRFLDAEGTLLGSSDGYSAPEEFLTLLKGVQEKLAR